MLELAIWCKYLPSRKQNGYTDDVDSFVSGNEIKLKR